MDTLTMIVGGLAVIILGIMIYLKIKKRDKKE